MTTIETGSNKPGVGRPLIGFVKMVRVLITIDPESAANARRLGGGNLSRGIRDAIKRVMSLI